MIVIGFLAEIWLLTVDPSDPINGYTPYTFEKANTSLSRDWGRRESVVAIPSMDGVLDNYGVRGGPADRRDVTFAFRVFAADLDAAYDRFAALTVTGVPVRLRYITDAGASWFTVAANARIQHTLTAANQWGSGGYGDFTVTWRIRPDWRPQYSEATDIWGVRDGAWGINDGLWGHRNSFALVDTGGGYSEFTLDATGTAGVDLPTLADTGPLVELDGTCGGDLGVRVANMTALIPDTAGVYQPTYFDIPGGPVGTNGQIVCDWAAMRFTRNGVPFRPSWPAYQRWGLVVAPGITQTIRVTPLGDHVTWGGSAFLDFWRRRA